MPPSCKRLTWVALVAVAALPVLTALVHHLRAGWYPESDDATIVLLAGDTFTADPPLVGMISTGGSHLDDPELHHPGPIELYVLAPLTTAGLGAATGSVITAAALAVVSIATFAWALHLLGGQALAGIGLMGGGLVLWGMGDGAPVSVWNPHVVVLPFAAFLGCAAAAVAGHRRALVGAVVTGSFVAQTHLSYVGLVGAVLTWVLVVTAWRAVRDQAGWRRAGAWAALASILLWLPPVVDQLTGHPGNLGQILRTLTGGGGDTVGAAGLAELGRVIGVPVAGLRPDGALVRVLPDPGPLSLALAAVPWAVLAVLAVVGRRRGTDGTYVEPVLATLAVALGAAGLTARRIPLSDGVLYGYYARWMGPLAVVFWTLVAWIGWRMAPAGPSARVRAVWTRGSLTPLGPVVLAAVLLGVAALPRPGTWVPWMVQRRIAGDLARAVEARPTSSPVVVRARGATPYLSTASAVVLARSQGGADVLVDPGAPTPVFPWREHRRYQGQIGMDEIWVMSGPDQAVPAGAVLVAQTPTLSAAERADLARRRARARAAVAEQGASRGPRPPSGDQHERVDRAIADPQAALADGTLADLAVRGLVAVPGLSPDDLHALQRLTVLESEQRVAVYLVPARSAS